MEELNNKIMVSIVIVNWNGKDIIKQCLDSIYTNVKNVSFEIIVVDNGSTDGSVEMLREGYPQVKLIECKENLGFGKANNLAVSYCRGEYILLLNNDTIMLGSGIIDIVNFAISHPDAGIVGGKVLKPDMTMDYSSGKQPGFLCGIRLHTIDLIKNFNFLRRLKNYSVPKEVDWVSGCYMLIPKKIVSRYGLFDEKFFMFGEDVELCFRMRQNGCKVYYVPFSPIIHLKGKSAKKNEPKSIVVSLYSSSYYLAKVKSKLGAYLYLHLIISIWHIIYILLYVLNFIFPHPKIAKKYKLFKDVKNELRFYK